MLKKILREAKRRYTWWESAEDCAFLRVSIHAYTQVKLWREFFGICENIEFEKMSYVLLCNSARMHVILLYNGILTVPTIYGRAGRESLFLLALVWAPLPMKSYPALLYGTSAKRIYHRLRLPFREHREGRTRRCRRICPYYFFCGCCAWCVVRTCLPNTQGAQSRRIEWTLSRLIERQIQPCRH